MNSRGRDKSRHARHDVPPCREEDESVDRLVKRMVG